MLLCCLEVAALLRLCPSLCLSFRGPVVTDRGVAFCSHVMQNMINWEMVVQVVQRLWACPSHVKKERNRICWVIPAAHGKGKGEAVVQTDLICPQNSSNNGNAAVRLCLLFVPHTKTCCISFSGTVFIPCLHSHHFCSLRPKPNPVNTAALCRHSEPPQSPVHVHCSLYAF